MPEDLRLLLPRDRLQWDAHHASSVMQCFPGPPEWTFLLCTMETTFRR